jgi:hypothetical protein
MKMNMWKLSTLVLAALLALTLGVSTIRTVWAEPQPHMRAAIAHLNSAKRSLEQASADKGGHRVRAIALVNQAIGEVEKGIAFDNRTPDRPRHRR